MTNSFLPDDYKVPSTSNYMKFQTNDNRFRILSKPVIGWEYWLDEDGKRSPRRVKRQEELPASVLSATTKEKQAKHFWAFVVWNYGEGRIQILELTQKSIMKAVETLSTDEDWGSPFDYDIVVRKEGDGLDTEYQTNPKPKKEVDEEVKKAYKAVHVELEALFKGEDPFLSNEIVDTAELDEAFAEPIEPTKSVKSEPKEDIDLKDLPF